MEYYNRTLQNGASPAQPGNGSGIFGWLGNLFSGITFDPSQWNFNIPTNQGSGSNFQPISFPNYQTQKSSMLDFNNPVVIVGTVIAAIVIIKLIND